MMISKCLRVSMGVLAMSLMACGQPAEQQAQQEVTPESVWRASMKAKNQAGLDRLTQNELQQACSNAGDKVADEALASALRKAAEDAVKYPEDGVYLGDWRRGEAIAANGKGMQWSDNPAEPNGGNCYACHELSPKEVAYGTIGPSLKGYGVRGQSEAMLKYTWAKIWNPHVFVVCSHMPRFGDAGILTDQQIRDVMAYLLDPNSPVNAK
jgi:L-cysteine S-thiosulfotransferase